MMEIAIIGIGYVGLVTGACFAEMGHQVWCIDIDEEKINNLQAGKLPIYEPGLQGIVEKGLAKGNLHFTNDIQAGIENTLFCFIAVGTPPKEDGSADLSFVVGVAKEIGRYIKDYVIVVTKSTVPVGTVAEIKGIIQQELERRQKGNLLFAVAFNPEFLKEGTAVADFKYPDRIVIGTDDEKTAQLLKELYQPILTRENQVLSMDIKSAELTKYAANAMLAARISFMNEIAQLCDKVGGNIDHIRAGIGTDHRIGSEFLLAGVGYGGSCFPKDVKELIHMGQKNDVPMTIAKAVHEVNERQKEYFTTMIKKRFDHNLSDKKIGIWGLAFKGQTDDMREAPSILIIHSLLRMGAEIIAYDPEAMKQARQIFREAAPHIQYVNHMMAAVTNVDALVLITDWKEFQKADFAAMLERMRQPLIFDGRNQYDPVHMKNLGFEYYCIGRNHDGW